MGYHWVPLWYMPIIIHHFHHIFQFILASKFAINPKKRSSLVKLTTAILRRHLTIVYIKITFPFLTRVRLLALDHLLDKIYYPLFTQSNILCGLELILKWNKLLNLFIFGPLPYPRVKVFLGFRYFRLNFFILDYWLHINLLRLLIFKCNMRLIKAFIVCLSQIYLIYGNRSG